MEFHFVKGSKLTRIEVGENNGGFCKRKGHFGNRISVFFFLNLINRGSEDVIGVVLVQFFYMPVTYFLYCSFVY